MNRATSLRGWDTRAAEVSQFPNTEPEDRFGIVQTDYSAHGITATQRAQGPELGWLGVLADFATGRAVQG
ncbi:MAG: hypothetical protein LLG14_15235, partial [Nocardiaceae bacterium]|nr:hypothetical protein [Nocardiaceae bacterium]